MNFCNHELISQKFLRTDISKNSSRWLFLKYWLSWLGGGGGGGGDFNKATVSVNVVNVVQSINSGDIAEYIFLPYSHLNFHSTVIVHNDELEVLLVCSFIARTSYYHWLTPRRSTWTRYLHVSWFNVFFMIDVCQFGTRTTEFAHEVNQLYIVSLTELHSAGR